jgi:phage terminase large subunit-like protein
LVLRWALLATLRFWDEAMPSRLNDQHHGVFIVIMQRVHERDLSGHILANELGWTHLCLPAVYEPHHPFPIRSTVKRKATGQIWTDPRQEGEPLWPERFSREALQRIAKDEAMSSHTAAGQLQQRPTAREGGLFKRQWFANPVKFAPSNLRLVRSWDFASSVMISNDPDWTVGLLMGLDPNTRLLYDVDVIRARLTPGQREQRVRSTALLDGDEVRIRIPQDPGGAGKFEAHHFVSSLRGYSVSIEPEQGTKERRPIRSLRNASTAWSSWSRAHGIKPSSRNCAPSPMAPMMTRLTRPRPRSVPLCGGVLSKR